MTKTRINTGDKAIAIRLPVIDGTTFDPLSVKGKPYMLSFYRFAACPFCNLRIHELVKRFDELGSDFTLLAVFDSPLDNLIHHSQKHQAPFPIMADESGQYYRKYAIEHSIYGMFKGMLMRAPNLIYAMLKGYLPTTFQGSLTTMPADFLIDGNGIIAHAYYGKDEGDHLPFEQIKRFSVE